MAEKKVKPIVLKDNDTGEEYTLEFNRDSVRFAESRGFVIEDVEKYPMTLVYDFFYYAFRMHHRNMSKGQTDKIIDDCWGGIGGIPEGVLTRLAELWAATFNPLVDEKANPRMSVEL